MNTAVDNILLFSETILFIHRKRKRQDLRTVKTVRGLDICDGETPFQRTADERLEAMVRQRLGVASPMGGSMFSNPGTYPVRTSS